jgi:hypothetical protein
MTLALLLGVLLAVVPALTARPATAASRRRDAARRARYVAAHPTHAGASDVVAALRRAGLGAGQARAVTDHALGNGLAPFTLWLWLERFGPYSLSVVVTADLTHRELLTHLGEGTAPDVQQQALFASANGLDLAALPGGRPASAHGPHDGPRRRRRRHHGTAA